jgi:hypothetical protein
LEKSPLILKAHLKEIQMNTAIKEQISTPKGKGKLHTVMVALIVLLSVFIIVCLSLTIFIIIRREPIEPRPMVLRHPSETMVPAGVTQQDLKQAMELTKDWAKSNIKGALSGAAKEDFNQAREDSLENAYPIWQMLESGRIVRVANETQCVILDSGWTFCQVKITQGPHNGQRYWVYRRCLSQASNKEVPEGLFCGFMCASVYVQYFLTAAICCAGIYTLKLKSMLMQILLFVIGMVILNFLWARIAMLMIM